MQIYISKNNQQLGTFEEAKVLELLANGQLSANDLGIRHGEKHWHPLGVLFPNFNTGDTASAAFNVQPTTFETSKKGRGRGAGIFMIIVGILIFLGGTTFTVKRSVEHTDLACRWAEKSLFEMNQAKEELELNKTEENLKKFDSKREIALILDKWLWQRNFCSPFLDDIRHNYSNFGLITTIIGFFKMR